MNQTIEAGLLDDLRYNQCHHHLLCVRTAGQLLTRFNYLSTIIGRADTVSGGPTRRCAFAQQVWYTSIMKKLFPVSRLLPVSPVEPRSSFASRAEWEAYVWELLMKRIQECRSASEIGRLLRAFISANDQRHIAARFVASERLRSSMSYRAIGFELGLSSQTISSIKKAFGVSPYRTYHERSKTERKKRVYRRDGGPFPAGSLHSSSRRKVYLTKFGTRHPFGSLRS